MKLIDYDEHRTKIQQKVMNTILDPKLSCRKTIDEIMELLDSIPADYTEAQMKEVDRAYQRVSKELEYVWNEKEKQRTATYTALHRIITERISQIQTLLLQYPDFPSMIGRLDELHMMLAECEKMAAEVNCENRMFRENLQAEPKLYGIFQEGGQNHEHDGNHHHGDNLQHDDPALSDQQDRQQAAGQRQKRKAVN